MARGAGAAALRPFRQAAGRCRARAGRCAAAAAAAPRWPIAAVWLVLLPARAAARRPLRHGAADRHHLLRAVRRQPAFHHGPGRHGVVRPCRLFRPRRLCRRRCCSSAPACRWKRRSCWRRSSPALFAVVYGWFCVRLSGVYLAMLTLAFAQISWSIVFQWDSLHRRQQRPVRHLAVDVARAASPPTTT